MLASRHFLLRRAYASSASSSVLLRTRLENDATLPRQLSPDPDASRHAPNRRSRAVKSGHFVNVAPTPLPEPYLISVSPDMASSLAINLAETEGTDFLRLVSGDTGSDAGMLPTWSTPYAVSVNGQPIPSPCPFNGNGYGDGRAISLGEVSVPSSPVSRWELQLKGAGPTPFSRMFDGRAVLRSSLREFVLSEAMFHLGVPTTRALSLVASESERVPRAWYGDTSATERNASARDFAPNQLIKERCAITCRVAPSFLRIGQLELFARRARTGVPGARAELEAIVLHALRREFADVPIANDEAAPLPTRVLAMVEAFAARQASTVAHWLRVGYVQGNMNSDNNLLSARTMDYGPCGFLERYDPTWTPFTSDPMRRCGFERQPKAAHVNLCVLAEAIVPLLADRAHGESDTGHVDGEADASGDIGVEETNGEPSAQVQAHVEELQRIVGEVFPAALQTELDTMRRRKLGLTRWDEAREASLWAPLVNGLLHGLDYTIFFRQLADGFTPDDLEKAATGSPDDEALLRRLAEPLLVAQVDEVDSEDDDAKTKKDVDEKHRKLGEWVHTWLRCVAEDVVVVVDGGKEREHTAGPPTSRGAEADGLRARQDDMRQVSPKFVPREWMLVEAYEGAERGDLEPLHRLTRVLRQPYAGEDVHDAADVTDFFRLATEFDRRPGVSFFS